MAGGNELISYWVLFLLYVCTCMQIYMHVSVYRCGGHRTALGLVPWALSHTQTHMYIHIYVTSYIYIYMYKHIGGKLYMYILFTYMYTHTLWTGLTEQGASGILLISSP